MRTSEQVQKELDVINAERDKLSMRAKALSAELQEISALDELSTMPKAKRAAMARALGVAGVPSASSVGAPSGK